MTYAELDRLFFERIRKAVVAAGLLPDIENYTNADDYAAAKESLKGTLTNGETLVEVFGVGDWNGRDEKYISRVVIDRADIAVGSLGAFGVQAFRGNGDSFNKVQMADGSMDVGYEVRLICGNTVMDRILNAVVDKALGMRKSFKGIANDGSEIEEMALVLFEGDRNLSSDDYMERLRRYVAKDVWLQQEENVRTGIVPMTTVVFSLYVKQLTGEETLATTVTVKR